MDGMRRTNEKADPEAFWRQAAQLGAELADEASARAPDPLLWVAALSMAMEALIQQGGTAFELDWRRARQWRELQESGGLKFGIEYVEESTVAQALGIALQTTGRNPKGDA